MLAPRGRTDLFRDFGAWYDDLVREVSPDYVVAIARGAIRLLQLQKRVVATYPLTITDKALPFLPPERLAEARFLLFDDSVVFGSTMADLREWLLSRRAHVSCAAFAVDEGSFLVGATHDEDVPSVHPSFPLMFHKKHSAATVRFHHAEIARMIQQSALHYNLDFPTFQGRFEPYETTLIPFILEDLRTAIGVASIRDVSTGTSRAGGAYRFSLYWDKDPLEGLLMPPALRRPGTKLRVAFLPAQGCVSLTMLAQLALPADVLADEILFADSRLNQAWQSLAHPRTAGCYGNKALLRLLSAFCSLVAGRRLSAQLFQVCSAELRVQDRMALFLEDVRVTLGADNAGVFAEFMGEATSLGGATETADRLWTLPAASISESPLVGMVQDQWRLNPRSAPNEDDFLIEAVGKAFLSVRDATDTDDERKRNPNRSRLEVGLAVEELAHLVRSTGLAVDIVGLSSALDICVDNGLAIVKGVEKDGRWLRAFYCGEEKDDQLHLQLQAGVHKAYSNYLLTAKAKKFTRYQFTKLCAVLADLLTWTPIRSDLGPYGRLGFVGSEEVVTWLTNQKDGPLKFEKVDDASVLSIREDFSPAVKMAWAPEQARDFYDTFDFAAQTFARISDEGKLLLSTCRTHRDTYNAIAKEAELWAGAPDRGGLAFLCESAAESLRKGESLDDPALDALYWCIQNLAEARLKHRVFYRDAAKLVARIEAAVDRQGAPAVRWWRFVNEKRFLDLTPQPEVAGRFAALLPIVRQMERLTIYTHALLRQAQLLDTESFSRYVDSRWNVKLRPKFFSWLYSADWVRSFRDYNAAIENGQLLGASLAKTRLRDFTGYEGVGKDAYLATAAAAAGELRQIREEYCPTYRDPAGESPYYPVGSRRMTISGKRETDLGRTFVLAIDLIGSHTSLLAQPFLEETQQWVSDRFGTRTEACVRSAGDQLVVVATDLQALWDIAQAVRIRGHTLREESSADPFRGTRKAIGRAWVCKTVLVDGSTVLVDNRATGELDEVFALLAQAQGHTEIADLNNVLLVHGNADAPLRQAPWFPKESVLGTAVGNVKHFRENYTVVALSMPR